MIEQSKSPKSLAYARLGKAPSAKTSLQDHRKPNRNSTGNIFEDVLQQIPAADNAYIRELVTKNQRDAEPPCTEYFHSRKKSYADMAVEQQNVRERTRDERETLGKSKHPTESFLMQVPTPKNSSIPINTRAGGLPASNAMISSFKKQQTRESSFLSSLNNYLEELNDAPQSNVKICSADKLSETLKISSGEVESLRMAAKLEQCQTKIKELKLKNYYQEKELGKQSRRQDKMRESLCQMLGEMRQMTAQLEYERKERKKLEKIIDNFDMRRGKAGVGSKGERKTIGKLHKLNLDQFDNQNTQEFDRDIDDSFRDFLKRSVDKKASTMLFGRKGLDSEKLDKLFRSHHNSDDSDQST